jgi:lipopolysaccharide biosynthesis regulator YciM
VSLFLSLVLAAFVGVLLAWVVGRFTGPRLKPPSPGQASYIAGLKALISGNALLAMKHLREAVEQDSANVDAYIRLGDLLRETGKVEKAVQVHQSLTVRPDLPASVQASVLESLAKDFLAVKKEHKALPVLEDLVSLNSKNAFGYEALSALYEADKRYPEAAKLQARLFELEGTPDKDQLALRYAHLGKAALDAGDRTPAKELFEQALTLSPDSIPSNLYLGDLHFASGAPDQAIACWKKVLDKSAEWAWLTFDRLEAAYFEEGSFESIASVYEGHLARHPKDAKAHVALARIKLKKGQVEAALENARLALEAVPMMPEARAIQIEGLARSGGAEIALSDALALAEDLIERVSRFRCLRCGREESDLRWRCPHCGSFGKMAYLPCAPSS